MKKHGGFLLPPCWEGILWCESGRSRKYSTIFLPYCQIKKAGSRTRLLYRCFCGSKLRKQTITNNFSIHKISLLSRKDRPHICDPSPAQDSAFLGANSFYHFFSSSTTSETICRMISGGIITTRPSLFLKAYPHISFA